jgi:hypothetical protein
VVTTGTLKWAEWNLKNMRELELYLGFVKVLDKVITKNYFGFYNDSRGTTRLNNQQK